MNEKNKKNKKNDTLTLIGMALAVSLLISSMSLFGDFVLAQEKVAEIYSLTYEPSQPVVLEGMRFSIGVKNNEQYNRQYKLVFSVVKEGLVKASDEFIFTLRPDAGTFFTPDYHPDDINDFDVITKLYDYASGEVLDVKTVKFNVVSEIGPFDLNVEIPTNFAKANSPTPVVVTLANMGEKGTDVNVELSLRCYNQTDMKNSFFIFLPAKSLQNKVSRIQTCDEEGQHEIEARVILFNRTWISSVNQIFLNKTYHEFLFDLPESISINPGESKVFDVTIRHSGTGTIHKLRLFVGTIPAEWVKISPEVVTEIAPDEISVFIVNITVPTSVEPNEYKIGISAAAEELLTRKETLFKINSLASYTSGTGILPSSETISSILSLNILRDNFVGILVAVFVLAGIFGFIRIARRKQQRYGREEVLRKLKDAVG